MRESQGVASLALGYVLLWAFSPPLLNPRLQWVVLCKQVFKIRLYHALAKLVNTLKVIPPADLYQLNSNTRLLLGQR